MAIAPGLGSFVAIGTLVTDAELVEEAPAAVREGCGSCTRCLDACPTGALVEPGVLDARRCLSYWTQSRHEAPADVADALEDRVYGCDICQDVCPYNAGPARRGAELEPEGEAWVSLVDWLELPDEELLRRYEPPLRARSRPALPAPQRADRARQRPARSTASWPGRSLDGGDPILAPAARRALG